jgi:FkbM family methyltransferase
MSLRATPRRYRLARHLVRGLSVLFVSRRKSAVERMLRGLFGDTVEAGGHLLYVEPHDRAVGARLRRRGVWAPAETELCKRELRPGMHVLDVGANIGYFTLLFARLVGPAGSVYAFEPEPRNFELLQHNVARNRYTNISAVAKAVSRTSGTQRLYKSPDNLGDHRLAQGPVGRDWVDVSVVALDEFFASDVRVDFIKLDIQGAECGALQGAHTLIARSSPVSLITEFWPAGIRAFGDDPEEYLKELCALGFRLSVIAPGSRPQLVPLDGPAALRALVQRDREVNLFCRKTRGG